MLFSVLKKLNFDGALEIIDSNERIHKFGSSKSNNTEAFIEEIKSRLPSDFSAKDELFVFIDECHRTQSGKMHRAMKEILSDKATIVGFTGTPLMKTDKKTTMEAFGPFIHTYKYDEAVSDRVILDLRYDSRKIEQELTSTERMDRWFDSKTRGLNNVAKAKLKKGDKISYNNLISLRPCPRKGIMPFEIKKIIGRTLKNNIEKGDLIKWTDLKS